DNSEVADDSSIVQSDFRTILQARLEIMMYQLRENIGTIESWLSVESPHIVCPWKQEELAIAWKSLATELSDQHFDSKTDFISYCGFKDIWSVIDTPASGILLKTGVVANRFVYAAVIELALILVKSDDEFKVIYDSE